jgi:outer membrane protein assembly factor BamD
MKSRITRALALLTISLALVSACSSSPDEVQRVPDKSPAALYEEAKKSLELGNFIVAIEKLEALSSRFPFGPHAHQAQFDLIYAYYKTGRTEKALASIDRFVRLNPAHHDVDYALYMRGLTNMDADSSFLLDTLRMDKSDRDPSYIRAAFNDFARLIEKYPNSKYAADARKRMIFLKNRMAKYEISVARFYMKRQAYIAAANRGRYVLDYFSDTPSIEPALEIMAMAYEQMGLDELRDEVLVTLRLNFPNNQLLR